VIVRCWTGAVPTSKAAAYLELMRDVAIPDYRGVAGNLAVFCSYAESGAVTQIKILTFWSDMEAIRAFAGANPARAKYYDFDGEFLLAKNEFVDHWTIDACAIDVIALAEASCQ